VKITLKFFILKNANDCQVLIDKVSVRIRGWPLQRKTYAGKAEQVKIILIGMYACLLEPNVRLTSE